MKKIVFFLLTICVVVFSCSKAVKQPVSYTIINANDTYLSDVFVPDSGRYDWALLVKFLSGNTESPVTLVVNGLPADVSVSPDTITAIPSYTADFIFTTNKATRAKYPISITASAAGERSKTYNLNLTVIPADCATSLIGTMTGTSFCSAAYNYTATGVSSGTTNVLIINNFGGYGSTVNVTVNLNCDNDSLFIANANYGNGNVIQGKGTFTNTSMQIYYTRASTSGGPIDTCSATFTR